VTQVVKEYKALTWPDWPNKKRTSSSLEKGREGEREGLSFCLRGK
jgi:hypothetical protein